MNKSWVNYSPDTWLNSLPDGSINSWLDFQLVFVRNFSSTYKRPARPRQLAGCTQGETESDRDYLTRWSTLRNTCDGVHDIQAVGFFINGCREGTMLKHALLLDEPKSMAELMTIADKYATADSAMRVPMQVDGAGRTQEKPAAREPGGPSNDNRGNRDVRDNGGNRDNRDRRDDRDSRKRSGAPDGRYENRAVNATEAGQPAGDDGGNRNPRQWNKPEGRYEDRQWAKPAYLFEDMMNGPCRYHSVTGKPASHTTARCSWTLRLQRGEGPPPPAPGPPPPQGGINIGNNQRNERPR